MKRKIFFIIPIGLAAFAIFGLITMLLWNSLMPVIFHLGYISFWQAVGLLILSRFLLGFSGPWRGSHNHGRSRIREKYAHMNPQEREEFRKKWHHRWVHNWHSCDELKDDSTKQENPEEDH
ncbi:MAG: hypothetical protein WCA84_09835 [Ignavibacteriaceae bacterium]|jgi:hypothetical protein